MNGHDDGCECFTCDPRNAPKPDRLDDPEAREERFDVLMQRLLDLVGRS